MTNLLKVVHGTLHAFRASQYDTVEEALKCGGLYSMSDDNEWTYTTLTDCMITVRAAANMMEHEAEINIFVLVDGKYIPAEEVQSSF